MSEIYRNSTQTVYLDIFGGRAEALPTAVVDTASGSHPLTVTSESPVGTETDRYSVVLTLADTQSTGEVKITWNFIIAGQTATKVDYFDVVSPLADVDDIRFDLDLGDDVTDPVIMRTERRVRAIIENFTGQAFAPSIETIKVTGTGDAVVRMPKRLIEVTSVNNVVLDASAISIERDGWALGRTFPYGPGGIIEDGLLANSGVIVAPGYYRGYRWPVGETLIIAGRWGWDRVPRQITEAALLLIEEKLSAESIYQEKYLQSLTSPDWRIQYNSSAFRGTGNVVADQILTAFRVNTAAVL